MCVFVCCAGLCEVCGFCVRACFVFWCVFVGDRVCCVRLCVGVKVSCVLWSMHLCVFNCDCVSCCSFACVRVCGLCVSVYVGVIVLCVRSACVLCGSKQQIVWCLLGCR